jgi:hypothetical protein
MFNKIIEFENTIAVIDGYIENYSDKISLFSQIKKLLQDSNFFNMLQKNGYSLCLQNISAESLIMGSSESNKYTGFSIGIITNNSFKLSEDEFESDQNEKIISLKKELRVFCDNYFESAGYDLKTSSFIFIPEFYSGSKIIVNEARLQIGLKRIVNEMFELFQINPNDSDEGKEE